MMSKTELEVEKIRLNMEVVNICLEQHISHPRFKNIEEQKEWIIKHQIKDITKDEYLKLLRERNEQKQLLDFFKHNLDITLEIDPISRAKLINIKGKLVNHEYMYEIIKRWLYEE